MGDRMACLIWCEACFRRNWGEVTESVCSGRVVVSSGVLKVAIRCGSCDAELAPGERVETVTLHSGLLAAAAWAAEFVLFTVECGGRGEADGV